MKFIFHTSASCADGTPRPQRYLEVIDEAICAEEQGFDVISFGEQHFNTDRVTQVSCPEMMTSAIATRTSVIRLRWTSVILLSFNHPIRVAERLATLDLISNGRAEMATARSNHAPTMAAFQIDPKSTREQWRESLDVIIAALTKDPFEHSGKHWNIPPTRMVPQTIQKPHPPIFYASTSLDGLVTAGELGLGAVAGNSLPGGWDYVAQCAETYHSAIDRAKPISVVNRSMATSVMMAHCAETTEKAFEEAREPAEKMLWMVINMFSGLAKSSPDYAYMDNINSIRDRISDMAYVNDRSPYVSIGTPDFHIERLKRLEKMGYQEVFLRIDGFGHDKVMQSLKMFGKHVIPEFRRPEQPASRVA
jgi:alkanesulfonate monooxygenase SsuD/methylene tetrahydromethanopterin reductase-like flavin-dependent oxidoreductase (luciferase family)